jgi:anti-anti-sigma factor
MTMKINSKKNEDFNVVEVEGRLDTTNYIELDQVLSGMLDNGENKLILDIGKLEYVSSSGLRIFLMYLKKIKSSQGRFILCNMNEEIKEIFEISGFINIFEIYNDLDTALNS